MENDQKAPEQELVCVSETQTTPPKPTAKTMSKIYCTHFGIIISNLTIFACCLSGLALLGTLVAAFIPVTYFLFLVVITMFSAGATFAFIPNFVSWWKFDTNIVTNLATFLVSSIPYLFGIVLAGSIVSSILLLIDKNNRHWGRFITAICLSLLSLIILLMWANGGLK